METNSITNAIILAGGKGTRFSEQTKTLPKPLIKVGPDAAIVHIIRHFVENGVTNIFIAGGYKFNLLAQELSKVFNPIECNSDSFKVISNNEDAIYKAKVTVIDTGYETGTALRIKKVLQYMKESEIPLKTFVTYGDTFSDVNLYNVSKQLEETKTNAVITAVNFRERFGIMKVNGNSDKLITKFAEKSQSVDEFINGGFIAVDETLIEHIHDTDDDFSKDTLPRLQKMERLGAYIHDGFCFAMDSQRDWEEITKIYKENPSNFLKQKENN